MPTPPPFLHQPHGVPGPCQKHNLTSGKLQLSRYACFLPLRKGETLDNWRNSLILKHEICIAIRGSQVRILNCTVILYFSGWMLLTPLRYWKIPLRPCGGVRTYIHADMHACPWRFAVVSEALYFWLLTIAAETYHFMWQWSWVVSNRDVGSALSVYLGP